MSINKLVSLKRRFGSDAVDKAISLVGTAMAEGFLSQGGWAMEA